MSKPTNASLSIRDLPRLAVRAAARAAHRLLTVSWYLRRPRTFGAHALALTPEKRVILVRLRYAPGWRLPGGGRSERESPLDAGLRELREEIGMISHGEARIAAELEEVVTFKRDLASLLIVRDVRYRPRRWSWEVEAVTEAALDALPPDLAPGSLRWIEMLRSKV